MIQFQQMENSQHLKESNFSKVTWLDSKKRTCNLRVCSLHSDKELLPGEVLLSSGVSAHETLPWLSELRRYEGLSIPSLSLRDFFHPIQKISSE